MSEQYVAKLSGKGQLTLPKKLREEYDLKEGDYLLLFPQGQGLRLEKAAISPLVRFREMAAETERRFDEEKIGPEAVEEAVRWARRQK
ncbi:AbrB/MazE/SpoVT family DNA-binding domain-containing protein [Candidatus Desulforudis audaxviator]|uniref:Transcriptional regulator, AbrB family n=1 Tax=Desulforudis audaxviator (strain MP104C) TaxID=477974 RepID=B1I6F2_DESAP|nr:AbrB/MazE/SpoVT family DNA-binding domain-containing protein [Candidatus Desulforudis audaxviator]ACA60600.1 transcriptional regulator, AbrB family [Candidatus Desulforudis audaxviator MP104C]AZK60679.1 Transcription regulator, SpoVT/AbrB family [Candidatus Desulforudis audaxviator]